MLDEDLIIGYEIAEEVCDPNRGYYGYKNCVRRKARKWAKDMKIVRTAFSSLGL